MKTVWITGGSTGIGYSTAKQFLKNNWRVVISSRDNAKLEIAKNKILNQSQNKELYIFQCDISNNMQVTNTINKITDQFGNINLAILNAAAYSPNKNQKFSIVGMEKGFLLWM